MLRADLVLVGGSVITMDVANPTATAVAMAGGRIVPEEAISLASALRAYTMGGAWANHADDTTGSIEAGKLADLVVLDRDIAREPPDRLGDARVHLTLVEGEPVYETAELGG